MKSKNKTIEALQKIPLVLYVLSFVVITAFLLLNPEKAQPEDLDQYAYKNLENTCAPAVVLLDYDYENEYLQSLDSLESTDSLSKHYYRLDGSSKVLAQYAHKQLYKVYFLKEGHIADGFIFKEYLHDDSCITKANQ